jgi:hypothetical protein
MKRKLIDFEVFKKIKDESLSAAEYELIEAEDVLARALGTDGLKLHCFGESDVTFETPERSFIHATYRITDDKNIILENIEELVIDEQTARTEARTLLTNMVEEILGNNDAKASSYFGQYLSMPTVRKSLMEGNVEFWVEKPGVKSKKTRGSQSPTTVQKRVAGKKKSQDQTPDSEKKLAKQRRKSLKAQFGDNVRIHARFKKQNHSVKAPKKKVNEWAVLAENVTGYVDYQEFGPTMRDSEVRRDNKGNVIALRIPTSQARNEGKLITLSYKHMLDTELKVSRGKMKTVHEDTSFWRAISDLRRTNALSDESAMQGILEAIVTKWPELIYLTHSELSQRIGAALESVGEENWDDDVCDFLAEGILRTATSAFSDRINRVARLAGQQIDKEHVYESFQAIISKFYPKLDESTALEMQVFVDLYNTLVDIHSLARNEGNEALRSEANEYLRELHSVINSNSEPTVELASEVADWLASLVEANVPGAKDTWDVSNTPHQTVVGDHPRMAWAADQHDAVPSKYPGDWGGKLPVSDGKSYKGGLEDEMRNRSWGDTAGEDTWPSLKNPYVPKSFGDYTMKGEKGMDKEPEDAWSHSSNDTWPNLQNPNVKDSPWDKSKYKMKADNLIVDK